MVKIEKEIQQFVRSYATKKGLRWRVVVPDGKGSQIRQQGFINKTFALKFAKKTFQNVLIQTEINSCSKYAKMTFSDYSKIWIDQKQRQGLVNRTIRRYSDMLAQYINPRLGCFKLAELQKFHLRNFISDMQDTEVSSFNINSSVTLVKMILRQAIEDDYMPMTNILTVKTPRHRAKDPEFWDYDEIKYFLNANIESENHNLWKFVLHTGMRASEVGGLKWDCVHFDMKSGEHIGFISVRRTCEQKTRIISERTKNNERRMIPIFPQIREMLLEMRLKAHGEFVFGGDEPIETSHLSRLLNQDLKRIPQLKRITFHGLRHSFCSFIDSTGLPRRIVSEIMGHRDLNTTNRYSHVSNQTLSNEISNWLEKQNQQNSNKVSLVAF